MFPPERELTANKLPKSLCQFKTEAPVGSELKLAVVAHSWDPSGRKLKQEDLKFQLLAGPHSKPASKTPKGAL